METSFKTKVLNAVRKIPAGTTLSYTDIAERAGSPRAYRAVATLMKNNYDETVPCHRVIHQNGAIGGYNRGGEKVKLKLLETEGYKV